MDGPVREAFLGLQESKSYQSHFRNEAKKVWYMVGLVSYGPALCGTGTPGVYTNVASYIPWIRRKLRP